MRKLIIVDWNNGFYGLYEEREDIGYIQQSNTTKNELGLTLSWYVGNGFILVDFLKGERMLQFSKTRNILKSKLF